MTLAIALQETGLRSRVQTAGIETRGLWRFDRAGRVSVVLTNATTRDLAAAFAERCGVGPSTQGVYDGLSADDLLACGFARLLLHTDLADLPPIDDSLGAWACYLRTFKPAKPRQREWAGDYATAMSFIVRAPGAT